MARSGRRFGPLFYLTLFGALLVALSVSFLPTAIVQGSAWRLSRQLLDADPATRQEAAQSLVKLGPTATFLTEQEGEGAVAAMLIPLLKHQEMTRRHQAITELIAHCPCSKALMATLDDCLKSDDGGVRCEAALYLLQDQPALASRALDTLVEQILEPLDGSYLPWDLIRRLKGDSFTRMMDSQVGSPESLAPVTRAMIDTLKRTDKPGRRDNALLTLGEIGPEAISAVPALLEVAGSRDRKCALAAVQALVKIDSKSAQTEIPALVNWTVSREERAIRLGAMAALRAIGPPAAAAVPALLEAADEEDLSISAAAIEALARIEPATGAALKRAIETGAFRSRDD